MRWLHMLNCTLCSSHCLEQLMYTIEHCELNIVWFLFGDQHQYLMRLWLAVTATASQVLKACVHKCTIQRCHILIDTSCWPWLIFISVHLLSPCLLIDNKSLHINLYEVVCFCGGLLTIFNWLTVKMQLHYEI